MVAEPLYLWLLLLMLPLGGLFWRSWRRSDQAISLLGEPRLLQSILELASRRRRLIRAMLQVAAFGLIIVALARPRWGETDSVLRRSGLQVVILLDGSRSMAVQDVPPARIEVGKDIVIDLLKQLEGNQVGMLMFGDTSYVKFPLTSDVAAASTLVEPLNARSLTLGGTNLAAGIDDALRTFPVGQIEGRTLIILTDGEQPGDADQQAQYDGEAIAAAREAARSGLTIHTIGLGTESGGPIPVYTSLGETSFIEQNGQQVVSKLNRSVLEQIASATGGSYFDGDTLNLNTLMQVISRSAPVDLEAQLNRRTASERFYVFAGLALLLLMLDTLVGQQGMMS